MQVQKGDSAKAATASQNQLICSYLPFDIEVFSGYIYCIREQAWCKQEQVKGLKER